MDWGLLRGTMKGKRLLRDRLKFPKSYYYVCMISNLILRFMWILTLLPEWFFSPFFKETQGLIMVLSLTEAYRRT